MKKNALTFTTAAAALFLLGANNVQAETNTLFVIDSSGSMAGKIDGTAKIDTAKNVLTQLIGDLPQSTNVGVMAYGHRQKKSCSDVQLVSPIGQAAGAFASVASLQPLGKTPIAYALHQTQAAFAARNSDAQNHVVLVSDGIETCGGDPCAVAQALAAQSVNVKVHVVGFDISAKDRAQLQCIAENGKGLYFDAANAAGLKTALVKVNEQIQKAPDPVVVTPARVSVFRDDFDGEGLSDNWTVVNEDPDTYIVEDGGLLLAASEVGGFGKEAAPNLVTFSNKLPRGNWDVEINLKADFQTGTDQFWLGFRKDAENYLATTFWTFTGVSNCNGAQFSIAKRSKGKLVNAHTPVAGEGGASSCGNIYKNKLDEFTGFLAGARTRIVLSKRGRKFFAALEITGKENGAVKRIKRETQTMSQLRLPGKLTIGLGKYREAAGEMMTLIDSIEIFKVNKNGTGS